MAVLPIILGVAAVGTVIALLAGGSAKASTGGGTTPGGTPAGARQRVIDGSTSTPGAFAAKYGGSFGKWKEIPDANPGVHIVYKHWDPESDAEVGWFSEPASYYPPGKSEESGLSPWAIGQVVNLPASWPG